MEVEGGGAAAGGEAVRRTVPRAALVERAVGTAPRRDRGKRKRGARTDRAGCNAREATRRPAEATAGETMADAPSDAARTAP